MLAEFVASIVGLAKKSNQVEFHTHEELPAKVFVRSGDSVECHDAPPAFRNHYLEGFDDLVAVLRDKAMAPRPEVYVSGGRIVALLDRSVRRDRVSVNLAESQRFRRCSDLQAKPERFQPRDLVKMLRLEFHGGNHGHVIQALSRIDFTRTSAGRTAVEHGRESLGRSVEAAVQQADQVPPQFTVGMPIWTNQGFTRYGAIVEFGVHLDLEAQVVELRVLSDEVNRVRNQALAAVVADLQEKLEGTPVFMGTP